MNLSLRRYGGGWQTHAKIIELTIDNYGTTMTVDVVNLKGYVDEDLIRTLRDIANELEEQNDLINKLNQQQCKRN